MTILAEPQSKHHSMIVEGLSPRLVLALPCVAAIAAKRSPRRNRRSILGVSLAALPSFRHPFDRRSPSGSAPIAQNPANRYIARLPGPSRRSSSLSSHSPRSRGSSSTSPAIDSCRFAAVDGAGRQEGLYPLSCPVAEFARIQIDAQMLNSCESSYTRPQIGSSRSHAADGNRPGRRWVGAHLRRGGPCGAR